MKPSAAAKHITASRLTWRGSGSQNVLCCSNYYHITSHQCYSRTERKKEKEEELSHRNISIESLHFGRFCLGKLSKGMDNTVLYCNSIVSYIYLDNSILFIYHIHSYHQAQVQSLCPINLTVTFPSSKLLQNFVTSSISLFVSSLLFLPAESYSSLDSSYTIVFLFRFIVSLLHVILISPYLFSATPVQIVWSCCYSHSIDHILFNLIPFLNGSYSILSV